MLPDFVLETIRNTRMTRSPIKRVPPRGHPVSPICNVCCHVLRNTVPGQNHRVRGYPGLPERYTKRLLMKRVSYVAVLHEMDILYHDHIL